MDAPTPPPPTPTPATPAAPAPVPSTPRSAQIALGVFLAVTFGLLAFRGYGSGLGARPTEHAKLALVDLNHAGRAELEQVPGLGPALAKEIADDRDRKGPFKSVEELRRVKGIGPATFDKVRAFVRVEPVASAAKPTDIPEPLVLERKPTAPTPAPYPRAGGTAKKLQPGDPPIDVNAAPAEELQRLPGVGPVIAQNIITARTDKPFTSANDLDRVKGIGPKTLDKLRPFVVVK
jgi:competence protein ComEA